MFAYPSNAAKRDGRSTRFLTMINSNKETSPRTPPNTEITPCTAYPVQRADTAGGCDCALYAVRCMHISSFVGRTEGRKSVE
jgi:hypothetical protein